MLLQVEADRISRQHAKCELVVISLRRIMQHHSNVMQLLATTLAAPSWSKTEIRPSAETNQEKSAWDCHDHIVI